MRTILLLITAILIIAVILSENLIIQFISLIFAPLFMLILFFAYYEKAIKKTNL